MSISVRAGAERSEPGKGGRLAWVAQLAFLAAHLALPSFIPKGSSLGLWHGRAALGIGLALALFSKRPARAAYAAAYITGAEVFWRMRKAPLPWEFAKYAIVLIFVVALVRVGRPRHASLPLLYFGLLLPSALLTIWGLLPSEARGVLSFNLSGPLALAVCAVFFSTVVVRPGELRAILVCILAPVLSIATIAAQNVRFEVIEFGSASNVASSGGFGPNQVSAMLGLGAVAIVLYLLLGSPSVVMTSCLIGSLLFLLRQVILTLSRGGLYMALGATAGAAFFLLSDSRHRFRLLAGGAAIAVLFMTLVLPRIEAITGGAVRERFSSLDSTGRFELMGADFKSWAENPVLGIGPGLGAKNRMKAFHSGTAHTEWTRLVGEHGVLGLGAAALLVLLAVRNIRRAPTRREKAIAVALIVYSFLFLAVDAMRLVAPAFALGLSGVFMALPRRRAAGPARLPRELHSRAALQGA